MSVSKAGQQVMQLIMKGVDTEDQLDRATGWEPEAVTRALAALSRRGLVKRNFRDGEMRYWVPDD